MRLRVGIALHISLELCARRFVRILSPLVAIGSQSLASL